MRTVELAYARMYYEAPIVFIEYKPEVEIGFVEIRELRDHAQELSGHRPYVVFSDVSRGISVTPMGRKVASDPAELPLHRGSGVLMRNEMLSLVANFFDKLKPEPYPFRAFTDRQQAIEWLKILPL